MADNPVENPTTPATHEGDREFYQKGADVRKQQKEIVITIIERYMLRGVKSATDLQKKLKEHTPSYDLSMRTVFRHMATIKRRNNEEVKRKVGINQSIEEMAYNLKKTMDEVTRELWIQYHSPVVMNVKCPDKDCGNVFRLESRFGAMVKVAALKEIRAASEEWLKTMQSLGLVYQAPSKSQLIGADGNPVDPQIVIEKAELNQQFIAFIKARHQDPVGTGKEEIQAGQAPNERK